MTENTPRARHLTKSAQVTQWLVELLKELFMFRTFSSEQLLDLVAMMSKNEVKAGTELIVQGDLGSKFYVVHFGGFDVLVQKAASEPARRVAHFGPASWFGEPALLYGSKRGATVKATKDSVVWALDREQYKWVLMAENRKVRDGTRLGRRTPHTHAHPHTTHPAPPPSIQGLVAEFLASNVDWLGAQVPGAKLEQIAESMQPVVYEDGQVAFRSGDTANSLMVITKGAAKYVPRIGGAAAARRRRRRSAWARWWRRGRTCRRPCSRCCTRSTRGRARRCAACRATRTWGR